MARRSEAGIARRIGFDPATAPKEIEVEWIAEQAGQPLTDFTIFNGLLPCFSERAVGVLGDCLERCAKVELVGVKERYVCCVPLEVVCDLDMNASIYSLYPSTGGVMDIKVAAFPKNLRSPPFFRISQLDLVYFVSEQFVSVVHRFGLTGFSFRECLEV